MTVEVVRLAEIVWEVWFFYWGGAGGVIWLLFLFFYSDCVFAFNFYFQILIILIF